MTEEAAILQMSDVACTHPGCEEPVLRGVSLSVSQRCGIGVTGKNGAGKSTLLCFVADEQACVGDIWRAPGLTTAYLTQQTVDWMLQQAYSPLGYMRDIIIRLDERETIALLGRFGISHDLVCRPMSYLSSGQCMRAALAGISAQSAHVLVLDEPTNGLDIFSIDALVKALNAFEGAVIFATHDRYLLDEVAEQVLVVSESAAASRHTNVETEGMSLRKRDRTWKERDLEMSS